MLEGSLLHVGCGGEPMPEWAEGKYQETRLDISPDHKPDILVSMTDMGNIGTFDVVYCSHSLEHLMPYESNIALKEFYRVLKPKGFMVLFVPDLEDVKPTEEVLFTAPCGPISGLDLIYGKRDLLSVFPYMAHRTGFIADTLERDIHLAGFTSVAVQRLPFYNLMAIGAK